MHEATDEGAPKPSFGDDQGSDGMKLVKVWRAASVGDMAGDAGTSCMEEGESRRAWMVISFFSSAGGWVERTSGSGAACSGSWLVLSTRALKRLEGRCDGAEG